ncbi:fluoride export protein 1-like isoform X3 [Tasmannia lanceolata]|uniref:fluoride export protein 1-like isoform X3 n=1 Tax=Tasmannia lanceolata TaxID=3420 RepID=UPI004062E6CC
MDENGIVAEVSELTPEDSRKIIEHVDVLDAIRLIADRDPAQRKIFIRGLALDTNNVPFSSDNQKRFPRLLECISRLTHLAVFGIMGVGSFLMGWLGIVFKADINQVSHLLAIGLTTGFLGSLTTFSGWNQKMLELSANGHWVASMLGLLIGMLLVDISIRVGVETATGFRCLLNRRGMLNSSTWTVDSYRRQICVWVVLFLLGLLWIISGTLVRSRLEGEHRSAVLWLAFMVGPPGVWLRRFLARLNGRGLGRKGLMKWVPFGTLVANVFAACLMAALATIRNVVDTKRCDIIVTGIQFGFLGCLSTVSTFVAEYHDLRQSKHPRRAFVYSMITIVPSFALGTLIYSVPVWTKGYQ